jgi:hypothetical protein
MFFVKVVNLFIDVFLSIFNLVGIFIVGILGLFFMQVGSFACNVVNFFEKMRSVKFGN